jgi:alpha-L-rhamnosidase
MAERTGTLWEHDGAYASCNHGFASHAVHVLYRDVLGLAQVDIPRKSVTLRFADLRLDWCEGSLPTRDGRLSLRWWKTGEKLHYQVALPAGYRLTVQNQSPWELVSLP